jgi:hypothetical protein
VAGGRCDAHVEVRPPLEQPPLHVRQPQQKFTMSCKNTYQHLYRRQNAHRSSSSPSAPRPRSNDVLFGVLKTAFSSTKRLILCKFPFFMLANWLHVDLSCPLHRSSRFTQ